MTKTDVLKIISMLEVAYPQHYSRLSQEQLQNQIMLWSDLLEDEDANIIANTVKIMIKNDSSPFPPTVGQICSKAQDLFQPKGMTEQQAWNHISRAIRNGNYHAREEWENLPEEVQEMCSPNDIRDWASMDTSQVQTVVSSNWQRSFKVREKARQEYNRLPNKTKELIKSIETGMLLLKGDDEDERNT